MTLQNFMLIFLGLQGFKVKGVEIEEEGIMLLAERTRKTGTCPICGKRTKHLHQYGKERRIWHRFLAGKRVYLVGRKRRWRCQRCQKVFTEEWPGIKAWSRRTMRAEEQILRLLRDHSFKRLEERYGISDEVARGLIKKIKLGPSLKEERRQRRVRLGVDEHSFRGRELVVTITNLNRRRVLAVLRDDRQQTYKAFLEAIPGEVKRKIEEVCLDMKASFIQATKDVLPKANIVIDHFHVIQDANRRLDETRRLEQEAAGKVIKKHVFLKGSERLSDKEREKLKGYLEAYPVLREWYWAKEQLRRVYKAQNKVQARALLKSLILCMERSQDAAMNDWGRTLARWQEYILNYFDHRTTNAYTEGVHTKMKLMKRMSYGFKNVEVYIKKMLLSFVPITLIPLINFYHTF